MNYISGKAVPKIKDAAIREVGVSFEKVLNESFSGARIQAEVASESIEALRELGLGPDSAIACLAICRDEICQSMASNVERVWGPTFNLAGLAGMIFAGNTGFAAAEAHSPNLDGRERYVFFAAPHIAIGPGGEPGLCTRAHRAGPSSACGALVALLGEIRKGELGPFDDPDDVELGLIRARLGRRFVGTAQPELDLISLTGAAHDVIREDLERTVAATVDKAKADYAVITGIQIHGPDGENYVQPRVAYAIVDGKRHDLALAQETPA
jgi:hypothetical protein